MSNSFRQRIAVAAALAGVAATSQAAVTYNVHYGAAVRHTVALDGRGDHAGRSHQVGGGFTWTRPDSNWFLGADVTRAFGASFDDLSSSNAAGTYTEVDTVVDYERYEAAAWAGYSFGQKGSVVVGFDYFKVELLDEVIVHALSDEVFRMYDGQDDERSDVRDIGGFGFNVGYTNGVRFGAAQLVGGVFFNVRSSLDGAAGSFSLAYKHDRGIEIGAKIRGYNVDDDDYDYVPRYDGDSTPPLYLTDTPAVVYLKWHFGGRE